MKMHLRKLFHRVKRVEGVSLVELIIYFALLTIVFVGLTTFVGTALGQFRTFRLKEQVLAQGANAIARLTQEAREATRVYNPASTFGAALDQLSIDTMVGLPSGETRTYVDFYVDNGVLYRKAEGAAAESLTGENVTVTAFTVARIGVSAQITLTLRSVNLGRTGPITRTFTTSVTPRYQTVRSRTQAIPFSYAAQSGPAGTGKDIELNNSAVVDGTAVSADDLDVNSGTQVTGNGFYVTSRTGTGTISGVSCQIGAGGCALGSLPNLPAIDLTFFRDLATAGGVNNGDIILNNETRSLGPLKIVGDLRLSGTSVLTITGPIWVTDDFEVYNSSRIQLHPDFATYGTVVVADDEVHFCCDTRIDGSGHVSSGFILMVSTAGGADATKVMFTENSGLGGYGVVYGSNFTGVYDNSRVAAAVGREVTVNYTSRIDYSPMASRLSTAVFAGEL